MVEISVATERGNLLICGKISVIMIAIEFLTHNMSGILLITLMYIVNANVRQTYEPGTHEVCHFQPDRFEIYPMVLNHYNNNPYL